MEIKDIKCPAVRAQAIKYAKGKETCLPIAFQFKDTKEGSDFWAKISRGDNLTLGYKSPYYKDLGGEKIYRFDFRVHNGNAFYLSCVDNSMNPKELSEQEVREVTKKFKKDFKELLISC